jgi:xylulose-5-phosphate/fructose-6-phosphate phosphoketolase
MPGEVIDRPNPEPLPSHLPDFVDQLMVQLDRIKLEEKDYDALTKFRRAACYIAAGMSPAGQSINGIDGQVHTNDSVAMIFLQDNVYLKTDLKPDDIKPRLLGKKYQISTRRRYLTNEDGI